MPRVGANLLPRLVRAVADQDGFSFGTPWLFGDGRAVVLPIVRTAPRPRRYVLAEEAADDMRAQDVGRIDRLRVRNETGHRVLLRSGALFDGGETQARGTTVDVLLEPRNTAVVEVACVHATQTIVPGAALELVDAAVPALVHEGLLRRDQGLVWASINLLAGSTLSRASAEDARGLGRLASDDLIAILSRASPSAEGGLQDIPSHERECGAFILDEAGVTAFELFDSPESWKVASRSFLMRQVRASGSQPAWRLTATVDPAATIESAKEFLDGLARAEVQRITTETWITSDPIGGFASLDGEIIHLAAFRPKGWWPRAPGAVLSWGRDQVSGASRVEDPDAAFGWNPSAIGATGSGDGEVAVSESASMDLAEGSEGPPTAAPVRRRKILSSGWDPGTFQALEHCSQKEFRGDRSAAMRFLVRNGLRRRGYLGPLPPPEASLLATPFREAERVPATAEVLRAGVETRILDLERIAQTTEYAGWLRQRARAELETMAGGTEDDLLRAAAQAALGRITPVPPPAAPLPPAETEPLPPPVPPQDVTRLLRQALAANAKGAYPEALALFDEALEAEPENPTALLGRAFALRRSGRTQEALAGFDLVLRLQPDNAAALLNLGRIHQERGELERALEAFDRLVAVAPNDWDVWMARGDVLAKMGRTEDARAAYAEALRRDPDNEELQGRMRAIGRSGPALATTGAPRLVLPRGMEEGQSYLVKETTPERSHRLLRVISAQKLPSLLITRESPALSRDVQGIEGVRILALGPGIGADVYSPTGLPTLARAVERFLEENRGRGFILVDGLAYLVANNGFRETVMFIEHVNEFIMQRRAILLVSVDPSALSEKELALLERNFKLVS